MYPILEADARMFVHCCDFSRRAVELVKQHEQYSPERVNAFVCDITSPTNLAVSSYRHSDRGMGNRRLRLCRKREFVRPAFACGLLSGQKSGAHTGGFSRVLP